MPKKSRGFYKISPDLKSQILSEVMQEGSVISQIAREYKLSSTTLYSWRDEYMKSQSLFPPQESNFAELLLDS